jgi:hypothetical protein
VTVAPVVVVVVGAAVVVVLLVVGRVLVMDVGTWTAALVLVVSSVGVAVVVVGVLSIVGSDDAGLPPPAAATRRGSPGRVCSAVTPTATAAMTRPQSKR